MLTTESSHEDPVKTVRISVLFCHKPGPGAPINFQWLLSCWLSNQDSSADEKDKQGLLP